MNRILLTLGAALGFLCHASTAHAIIASVKSTGMAATAVAYPQDALCAAYNPAGNAEIGDRLDFGITWAHDRGRATIRGNRLPIANGSFDGYKTKNFYSPDFGINKTFGCDCQYAVGFLVYNRNQSKTTYNTPFPLIGTSNLGLEYVHEELGPVFAWKVHDCLSLGLSVNINIQRLKVNGVQNFDNPVRSRFPGKVTNRGYSYSSGVGFTVGAQWHVYPTITLGLAYQNKTDMRRFKKYKGFIADRGSFDIPERWFAGIAWRVVDCVTLAFDVQHDRWSRIRALHNSLLDDGVLHQLGSKNGPGFGWVDQTFYRVGIDYAVSECLIVRAGYRHVNTPIRRSQTVVNQLTLDTLRDVVTVGATYMFNECYEASTFFAWGFRHKVSGRNSIPVTFGGGESDLKQQKYALGISFGWNY